MRGRIAGSRHLPECLDDWIDENNPVRVIDAFVDALDLAELGFEGVEPAETGRPAYHPSALLRLYVYGYLNRVQSSRRLERFGCAPTVLSLPYRKTLKPSERTGFTVVIERFEVTAAAKDAQARQVLEQRVDSTLLLLSCMTSPFLAD